MRNSEPVPICAPRLHQAPLPLPLQKHINDAMLKPDQMDAKPSQRKVSLTTPLLTKLLTIRSHSRSPRRTFSFVGCWVSSPGGGGGEEWGARWPPGAP